MSYDATVFICAVSEQDSVGGIFKRVISGVYRVPRVPAESPPPSLGRLPRRCAPAAGLPWELVDSVAPPGCHDTTDDRHEPFT